MNFKVKIPIDLMSGKNLHRRVAEDRGGSQDCQATMGQERLRGATPRSRSGGAAVKSDLSSKVTSSSCALLEQPWRNTPHPR